MVVVWIKFAEIGVWCRSRGDLPKMFFGMIEACDIGISLSLPSMILSDGCHQRFGEPRKFGKPMHRHEELPARRSASRSHYFPTSCTYPEKTHGIFFELFPWFLLGESLSSGCIQVSFLETDQAFEEGFRSNRRVMVTDQLAWTLNQLAQKKMLPSSRSLRWGA